MKVLQANPEDNHGRNRLKLNRKTQNLKIVIRLEKTQKVYSFDLISKLPDVQFLLLNLSTANDLTGLLYKAHHTN